MVRRGSSEAAQRTAGAFCFDNTLGGSLPILSTLRSVLRTGDKLKHIECAISGSMNWLTSALLTGIKFSEAVQKAEELNYTEQDPLEDLAGIDMARKAIVLAKQLGFHITLDQIELEPIVPVDFLQQYVQWKQGKKTSTKFPEPAALVATLQGKDDEVAKALKKQSKTGRLRYVTKLTLGDAGISCSIKPCLMSSEHPLYIMNGTELFTAFTLVRQQNPLVMRGAQGAGKASSAGILNDVLKITQRWNPHR